MMAKSNWYKQKTDNNEDTEHVQAGRPLSDNKNQVGRKIKGKNGPRGLENERKTASTMMFVPWTSKGKLVGRLKEEEERISMLTDFKVNFQEEGGTPLWLMFPTSLVEGLGCDRGQCRTCQQDDEKKVDCFASSVVY